MLGQLQDGRDVAGLQRQGAVEGSFREVGPAERPFLDGDLDQRLGSGRAQRRGAAEVVQGRLPRKRPPSAALRRGALMG